LNAEKLFSLSGVVPLGLFLVLHVMANGRALVVENAFTATFTRIRATPGIVAIEIALVFVPLAFHAAYGVWLVAKKRALATPSPYEPWLRAVHRAAGVVALAYIAYHLYEYSLHGATPGATAGDYFTVLSARLSTIAGGAPLRAMFYVLGVAAVALHFAVGLWGFMVARKWFVAPRARRFAAAGAAVIGAALFLGATNVVTYFATGARLIGRDGPTPVEVDPTVCPAPSASSSSK